jgi:hypothetical protein
MAQETIVAQRLLIIEASQSYSRPVTAGRNPLDEWSLQRKDLYVTAHNTHKRETSMHTAGFEPAFLASERPQTHAIDRVTTTHTI